jgi:hypothetical protein
MGISAVRMGYNVSVNLALRKVPRKVRENMQSQAERIRKYLNAPTDMIKNELK